MNVMVTPPLKELIRVAMSGPKVTQLDISLVSVNGLRVLTEVFFI
jgi:hypothetical protein